MKKNSNKIEWLSKNSAKVALHFEYTCQNCNIQTPKGAVHHNHYSGRIYDKTPEQLLAENTITWLCKPCHEFVHIAYTKSEVNKNKKHSGYCAICDKFAWHAWFNIEMGLKFWTRGGEFPICKECLVNLKQFGILEQFLDEDGSTYMKWGEEFDLSQDAKLLLKSLKQKLKIGFFGKPKQKKEQQLNFFDLKSDKT